MTIFLLFEIFANDEEQMRCFKDAAELVEKLMIIAITSLDHVTRTSQIALQQITKAFTEKAKHDPEGRILVLTKSCPAWKEAFKKFRMTIDYDEDIQFIIFPAKKRWRVGIITIGPHIRKHIKCEEVLRMLPSFEFVHKNMFVAEFREKEDAIKGALMSL